jgi:hypothetical protein
VLSEVPRVNGHPLIDIDMKEQPAIIADFETQSVKAMGTVQSF